MHRLACSTDCTSAPAALRLLASALGGGTGWEGREGPWCRARRPKPFPNHPGHSVGSFVARLRPMPPPRALGSRIEFAEQKGARAIDTFTLGGRARALTSMQHAPHMTCMHTCMSCAHVHAHAPRRLVYPRVFVHSFHKTGSLPLCVRET